MEIVLLIAGGFWMLAGILVYNVAASAIHEILACLAVSFGMLFWGLSGVLMKISAWQQAWEKTQANDAAGVRTASTGLTARPGPVSTRI